VSLSLYQGSEQILSLLPLSIHRLVSTLDRIALSKGIHPGGVFAESLREITKVRQGLPVCHTSLTD
jgi:hypothetical protein